MGESSTIPWVAHPVTGAPGYTWSPWGGCAKVSPGCQNCYAEAIAHHYGRDCWGSSPREDRSEGHWLLPARWNRKAEAAGETVKCFPSTIDPFEMRPELEGTFRRFFHVIANTPWIEWLLLTKRPENILAGVAASGIPCPRNIRLGTSVETQKYLWRVKEMVNAALQLNLPTFVSVEPQLEALRLPLHGVDHVIQGAESGKGRRPFDIEWMRPMLADCRAAGIPYFAKQDSAHKPDQRGRIPDDLWIREMPPAMRAPNTLWTEAPKNA